MHIKRVIIKNYRALEDVDVQLNAGMNILVGNNEAGKSTFLEAINLALTCQLSGRGAANELHPHLFTYGVVATYLNKLERKQPTEPPSILIELYFDDDPRLSQWKGTHNSTQADCPGVALSIRLNEDYREFFQDYVKKPSEVRALPIDYYRLEWLGFHGGYLSPRNRPLRCSSVDASTLRSNTASAARYVLDIADSTLTELERIGLSISYRGLREQFLQDPRVNAINNKLKTKQGFLSAKQVSLALDATQKSQWESFVLPHLDEIPISLIGKGEQNNLKIRLAMDAASSVNVLLVEEPENHLSHTNMSKLIDSIRMNAGKRQIIITTHSSYVINKLGLNETILLSSNRFIRLNELPPDTADYFMKLPGYDTLRMLLAKRSILVEGPSDELVVQKAYLMQHNKLPLEDGVEVISVRGLAFKRFLDLAKPLRLAVCVLTDNDGDANAVKAKYVDYESAWGITIQCSGNESLATLEPQLLSANGRNALNIIFGTSYSTDDALLAYMSKNKTECALQIFSTQEMVKMPQYILDAIK